MATIITFDMAGFKQAISENIEKYHRLYFFEGIAFVLLGLFSILMPQIAAEVTVMLLGAFVFTAGLFQAYFNFKTKRSWWFYFSTWIPLIFGTIIMLWPDQSTITLASLIAIFLIIKGFAEIFTAAVIAPAKGWGYTLLSGLITLLLSAIVWSGWPITTLWFLGVVIGINFGTFGFALISLARNHENYSNS